MIYGPILVFKVLSNLAFKNIPKNGQKPFKFSFYIPIQNLCRNLSWSLNKSCRELNSKQFSFLGHFQKMSFSCSKIGLKLLFEVYLKLEIEIFIFHLTGSRASFPAHRPKPTRPPRLLPLPHTSAASRPWQEQRAPWPPCAGAGEHMAVRWPPHPTRPPTPSAPRPLLGSLLILSLRFPTATAQPSSSPPPPSRNPSPKLPVPAIPAHRKPLRLAPSSVSLLRSPRSPPLPVVSFPSAGIARRSPGRAHRRTSLCGRRPSAPPFSFLRARISFALLPRCSCASPRAVSWPEVIGRR
jgi:hypothetical protein